ncbi:protein lethal(3)malignant blood neoplasm 1 isoform X2 [Ceratitis capitata]|uniref:Protein lethal(3)malignant blood neoplasm 1 n=1 Tax=Ceratitis capitata TaxID=7213 RepID=W8BXD6_CERCA|nr:protein lethal(3)malignant blood neoplasm 1 isoform X2 [Ceratitis capitata]
MHSHSVMTFFFLACLTVLYSYLPCTEAASTERPYQFGFTIEKQQHRQEKKDERGIVMGEFGFITADGIYHVTVYATDEEGKFRILAMRSYPYEDHPKTIEMVVRPKAKATTPKAIAPPSTTTTTTTTERAKPKPFEKHNFSVQGCSGCFLKNDAPTTTTTTTQKPEDKKYDINLLSRPLPPEEAPRIGGTPPSNTINNNSAKTPTTSTFGSGSAPKTPIKTGSNAPSKSGNNQPSAGKTGTTTGISTPKNQLAAPKLSPSAGIGGGSGSSASTGGAGRPNANAGFAGGVSGGNNNAGGSVGGGVNNRVGNSGNTASGNKIGGNTGAGASSAAGEAGDLYRFKYLLDYNGHRETGARNGNKEGSFYAIGDDNVERTIEYIANEFGYQPRVRFRKLDAPVQAKENTLKDYEFVWFKKE